MTGPAGPDLRDYLDHLRGRGELVQVERTVSANYELSAVVKALEPAGAPAVMFASVAGSDLPVVSGLFGRRHRIADALGVSTESAVAHVLERMKQPIPALRISEAAPVHEVTEADLGGLPIGVHSKDDAGRYITCGVLAYRDDLTGAVNTGIYRLMVRSDRTITVNAAPDHDLGRAIGRAAKQGVDLPIAIVVGHHPAYAIASQLKNSVATDSHDITGSLLGQPLVVAAAKTIDLDVPAAAEIVIEGMIRTRDLLVDGPFGEFSYYYGSAAAPVCEITAVTRRADAIYHDLHPTHAEHRCLWLFPGREARLFESVRRAVPGTAAVRIPFYGGSLSGYLKVRKSHDQDGKQALLAAFAADHFLKHVIVVDEDIDVFDDSQVWWALNVRFQANRDLVELDGVKGIRMDPSADTVEVAGRRQATTAKLGFDATRPLSSDFPERADLVPPGFGNLALDDYLAPSDVDRLERARHGAAIDLE